MEILHVTLVVRDYDEAIRYYTNVLGFTLVADEVIPPPSVTASLGRHGGGKTPAPSLDDQCRFAGECGAAQAPQIHPDWLEGGKRWVVVRPPLSTGASLVLARAANDAQRARVGDQTGGRVFLFLQTIDFARDHTALAARGVKFIEDPRDEPYGMVAVFEDLYGNRWDLIQPYDHRR